MVYNSLCAAGNLEMQGISATVIDMHTIKPLDTQILDAEILNIKLMVSVEEHSTIGGLGGAMAEHLSALPHHPVLLRLGMEDRFQEAGDYTYMLEQNGLLPEQIAASIQQKFSSM